MRVWSARARIWRPWELDWLLVEGRSVSCTTAFYGIASAQVLMDAGDTGVVGLVVGG